MARAKAEYEVRARDRSRQAMRSVRGQLRNLRKELFSVRSAMALISGGALGAMIKSNIKAGDEIQKLSIRLGASTEALSEYRLVADRAGVSFNTLTIGIQRMTRRVAEAANGSGEAQNALKELGVDARRLSTLRADQQFEILAEALSRVESDTDRVRLGFKLFDSEGVALLQTMTDGAAGIRSVREEAAAMGLTLSQTAANEMAAAQDAMTNVKQAVTGLVTEMTGALAPSITTLANSLKGTLQPAVAVVKIAFLSVGKVIGGVAAAIVMAVGGEFSAAFDTIKQSFADAKKVGEEYYASQEKRGAAAMKSLKKETDATTNSVDKLLGKQKQAVTGQSDLTMLAKKARNILAGQGGGTASRESSNRTVFGREFNLNRQAVEGFAGGTQAQKVKNPEQDKILRRMATLLEQIERNGKMAGTLVA